MHPTTPPRLTGEYSSASACAEYAGVSSETWRRWSRTRPNFPRGYKFGPRVIRFRTEDVLKFLEQEQQATTQEV